MERRLNFSGRFAIVFALTLIVLLLPTPPGLSPAGKRALTAFIFAGGVFALQPVSLPFASLMVSVALVVLGVADTSQAFEALSRPIIILILGSLFLAEALRKHGITRRLALTAIVSSGGDVSRLLLGLMGIAALLSMWMENTATTAVLIPVALIIANRIEDKGKAGEVTLLLVMGIAYGASLGGMVTITGSASNAVASGFLTRIQPWSFIDWVKYGFPSFLLAFPLTWWALSKFIYVRLENIDIGMAREEKQQLGPVRTVQWEIVAVLTATAILWIVGSDVERILGLPPTMMSPAVIAMVAVTYMALRDIIAWEDVKGVSWGMFFTIGAGLALGEALIRTGATAWLTVMVAPAIVGSPVILRLFILIFSSALLTNIVNNATVAAVFVPILISIAEGDPRFSAVQLVLPLTLATTFGYALPSASGRMALLYETGIVERRDMISLGVPMTVLSSICLTILFYCMVSFGLI